MRFCWCARANRTFRPTSTSCSSCTASSSSLTSIRRSRLPPNRHSTLRPLLPLPRPVHRLPSAREAVVERPQTMVVVVVVVPVDIPYLQLRSVPARLDRPVRDRPVWNRRHVTTATPPNITIRCSRNMRSIRYIRATPSSTTVRVWR